MVLTQEQVIEKRFWSYVTIGDDCFEWTGLLTPDGYGRLGISSNKKVMSHRYAYELFNEPIPEGMTIDHLCRNRRCCNPTHLEAVTIQENIRRGAKVELFPGKCIHGHEYTPENTLRYASNNYKRVCKTCKRGRK